MLGEGNPKGHRRAPHGVKVSLQSRILILGKGRYELFIKNSHLINAPKLMRLGGVRFLLLLPNIWKTVPYDPSINP